MGRMHPLAFLLAAGCYQPVASPGAPCSVDGECPSAQRCVAGTCRPDGFVEPLDAPIAPPIDDALDAPDAVAPLGPWSSPTKIPGVNTTSVEGDPSLTPDRLTIVFISNRNGNDDVFIGTRATTSDPFTVSVLAIVNSGAPERSAEISADGATLFFTSRRNGNEDVFRSTKIGGVFSPPLLVTELSTTMNEGDVAISPDGLTALVARANDLYLTTRTSTSGPFAVPTLVPELDITDNVAAPSLTDDAAAVYLHAGATRDLYVAYRQGPSFTTPVPIAELDTAAREAAPFVSSDDRHLAFERDGELFESSR